MALRCAASRERPGIAGATLGLASMMPSSWSGE